MKKILILGATSAIAQETARIWSKEGAALFLVGRDASRLNSIANDLKARGASQVNVMNTDLGALEMHDQIIQTAIAKLESIDIALIAHGTLSDQKKCEESAELAAKEIHNNAISTISLLTIIANIFEMQRKGVICVIGSVAGDRGRASNYVYGSAKALVTTFMSGLRQRLHSSGVNVVLIKPGFVDTPMTANFPKGALWSQPEPIAKMIALAITKKSTVVYAPSWWRYIMFVIKSIPEKIFQKISL